MFDVDDLANRLVELVALVDELQDLATLQQPAGLRLFLLGQGNLSCKITSGSFLESRTELGVKGWELSSIRQTFE